MMNADLILMAALPTSWLVVGIVLVAVSVVAVLLLIVKAREAALLKKEVMELRDTMRMMRYEEANLARMLHTVDKAAEVEKPTPEMLIAEAETDETDEADETDDTETDEADETDETETDEADETDDTDDTDGADESNEVTEAGEVAVPDAEPSEEAEAPEASEEAEPTEAPEQTEPEQAEPAETEPSESSESSDSSVSSESSESSELPEEPVIAEPPAPKPRKQAINERRPAIPNDLFAAWFEEQDNQPSEPEPAPEVVQPEAVEATPAAPVAADVVAAEPAAPVAEPLATESAPDAPEVQPEAPAVLSKEDEKFCRKLERIVNTRMRNPNLNVDVIAAQFGMGRTNFYRKVRELTTMSPNDYLRKCRMERAAELLRTTELTVADICSQVGIPDAQYFSRVFKTHFGVPPSAYREQL